jgi:hypothetical protein
MIGARIVLPPLLGEWIAGRLKPGHCGDGFDGGDGAADAAEILEYVIDTAERFVHQPPPGDTACPARDDGAHNRFGPP